MAVLLAKVALFCPGLIAYLLDRGDGRAGRPAGFGYHRVHAAQATIADIHVRPGDQLLDLLLILSAERARQKVSRIGHSPTVFEQQHMWPQDNGCRWPAHGGSPRAYRAWPLAWPSPSGPLGRQRSPGSRVGACAHRLGDATGDDAGGVVAVDPPFVGDGTNDVQPSTAAPANWSTATPLSTSPAASCRSSARPAARLDACGMSLAMSTPGCKLLARPWSRSNGAAQCACGCPPRTAVACMGCCSSPLYGTTGARKNTVKVALTPVLLQSRLRRRLVHSDANCADHDMRCRLVHVWSTEDGRRPGSRLADDQ